MIFDRTQTAGDVVSHAQQLTEEDVTATGINAQLLHSERQKCHGWGTTYVNSGD